MKLKTRDFNLRMGTMLYGELDQRIFEVLSNAENQQSIRKCTSELEREKKRERERLEDR